MAKADGEAKAATKSVNYRPIAIAASIAALVFVLLLLAEADYVSSLQGSITGLQTQINNGASGSGYTTSIGSSGNGVPDLQAEIASLQSQISQLQSQNSQLQTRVSGLQSTVSQQLLLLNLKVATTEANQQVITQGVSSQTQLVRFNAGYAGYVAVSGTSTVNGTVIVNGQNYSIDGSGFSLAIPVAPGMVTVSYENPNPFNGATTTMSVVYYS
jgi:TolA-binding protein